MRERTSPVCVLSFCVNISYNVGYLRLKIRRGLYKYKINFLSKIRACGFSVYPFGSIDTGTNIVDSVALKTAFYQQLLCFNTSYGLVLVILGLMSYNCADAAVLACKKDL